jgi:hypothetical protein
VNYSIVRTLRLRKDIPEMLTVLRLNKRFAELGVLRGRHFDNLMRMKPEVAVGIDMWHGVRRTAYLAELREKYKDNPSVQLIKKRCEKAVRQFPDGHFDFVYVDASHSYAAVERDIRQWLPKIHSGGIIAGHDYTDKLSPTSPLVQPKGVVQAVNDAIEEYGLAFFHVTNDEFPTWLAVKA